MSLAFVPGYIRYLGVESYGLIGLFSVMQAWLTMLDMGMTPTLGREMARFTASEHSTQSIHDLLRSLEFVFLAIAASICIGTWVAADWLANDWLKPEQLPTSVVRTAITVMAFVVSFRFVEGIYRSALFGLQQQVWYNASNAALATLRSVGALAVLALVSPTIAAFFLWQAFISLLSIIIFAAGVYRALPRAPAKSAFSTAALARVWRFAGGMTGITVLAVALTQLDKVLLSRLLSLESFGYYTLAATVAGSLYLLITPVTTAVFPKLVELVTRADLDGTAKTYHQASQLVTLLTAPAALLLAFFSEGVIFTWSGNAGLARSAGPLLSTLAIGTFLNGLMYMPYQLQLAHGWTRLAFRINLVAVTLLVPALFWIVPRHGALSAAWVWIALNSAYVLVGIQLMHLRIMPAEKWRWYVLDVGLPTLGAASTLLILHAFIPHEMTDRLAWLAFLVTAFTTAVGATAFASREVRTRLFVSARRLTGA